MFTHQNPQADRAAFVRGVSRLASLSLSFSYLNTSKCTHTPEISR